MLKVFTAPCPAVRSAVQHVKGNRALRRRNFILPCKKRCLLLPESHRGEQSVVIEGIFLQILFHRCVIPALVTFNPAKNPTPRATMAK